MSHQTLLCLRYLPLLYYKWFTWPEAWTLPARIVRSTLVELLRWRAEHQPDYRAHTFLVDRETQEVHLTYRQLDEQARPIATWLQSHATPGERALLLFPPGLEFITTLSNCLMCIRWPGS